MSYPTDSSVQRRGKYSKKEKEIREIQKKVRVRVDRREKRASEKKNWSGAPYSRERLPVLSGCAAGCIACRTARCCLFQCTPGTIGLQRKRKGTKSRKDLPFFLRPEKMEDSFCSRCPRKYSHKRSKEDLSTIAYYLFFSHIMRIAMPLRLGPQ